MIDITARLQSRERAVRSSPAQTSTHFNHENEGANGPLVLVVEDHAATQNVLFSVLDLQGYRVVCASNGQEALEWLLQYPQTDRKQEENRMPPLVPGDRGNFTRNTANTSSDFASGKAIQAGQRPALILLDLFMPVMNGADFLARMRASWPSTEPLAPVILFTVDQDNHDDLACTEVLPKPFHIKDLLAKIKLVLGNEQMMH